MKTALPDFFANADTAVSGARDKLLQLIGNAAIASNQKFLGTPISDLSVLGDTLYDAYNSFVNHTNEISGVGPEDKAIGLQLLYGNVTISGATVNTNSTNVATINASAVSYPMINVGETIIINSQELVLVGKRYTAVSGGTVSVNTLTSNVNVISSSVSTLNLALSITPGMYINVNSTIKQVNTVNAYGDYLTVYTPFIYSASGNTLYKESSLVVNTAITTTANDLTIKKRTPFVANSLCLGNTITGVGTTFTTDLAANDKVYFDDKEFWVTGVTDTVITLDDQTRLLYNVPVYKVVIEYPLINMTEGNKPDDILSHFATLDQMTSSMGGNLLQDYTVKFMGSTGAYEVVPAAKPTDVVKSLDNGRTVNRITQTIQGLLDDFQGDAIRSLTNAEITQLILQKTDEVNQLKNDLIDSVKRDIAAINAVKGLLQGLLKLFVISCSKKKAKNGDSTSDDYLNLILVPNPQRQGCAAVSSDLISILDQADTEYNDPGYPDATFTPFSDDKAMLALENLAAIDDYPSVFDLSDEGTAGDPADVIVDEEPTLPPAVEDPCAKPC